MATSKNNQTNQTKANQTDKTPRAPKTPAEKQSAFVSAAPKRVDRVVKAVRGLSKLARTASYEWTPVQLDRVLAKLGEEFSAMESAFRNPTKKVVKDGFSF